MKKNKISITLILLLVSILYGCQNPDDLLPSVSRNGLNSITATFADDTGDFSIDNIDGQTERLVIPIPYYYPETSNNRVTPEMLTNMKLTANLDDNVIVSPQLLVLDLNKENEITVTDQLKNKKKYIITGEIYKLRGTSIKEIAVIDNVSGDEVAAIVNEAESKISLLSLTDLTDFDITKLDLSPHASATISTGKMTNLDNTKGQITITVTAQDESYKKTYRLVQEIPDKIERGIRAGSGKIMFVKKLNADLGITTINMTGGIAATKDYVVLNTRGEGSVYINAKTGERVGSVNLGAITGSLTNFYNTADASGNILINNLAPNAGTFKIWKLKSVNATPELYIDWSGSGTYALGRKVSVVGSLDGDAIITAPLHNVASTFARWIVRGGVLTSQTPELIKMNGIDITTANIDLKYSITDLNSDYYTVAYSNNRLIKVNGTTNGVSQQLDQLDTNYICNAVDYINFNNNGYVAYNHVNSFSWGSADKVFLINADGNFSGVPGSVAFWQCTPDIYGGKYLGVVNGNGTGDVCFVKSADGYYLYLYFMFTNGSIVGVQFDCMDI